MCKLCSSNLLLTLLVFFLSHSSVFSLPPNLPLYPSSSSSSSSIYSPSSFSSPCPHSSSSSTTSSSGDWGRQTQFIPGLLRNKFNYSSPLLALRLCRASRRYGAAVVTEWVTVMLLTDSIHPPLPSSFPPLPTSLPYLPYLSSLHLFLPPLVCPLLFT